MAEEDGLDTSMAGNFMIFLDFLGEARTAPTVEIWGKRKGSLSKMWFSLRLSNWSNFLQCARDIFRNSSSASCFGSLAGNPPCGWIIVRIRWRNLGDRFGITSADSDRRFKECLIWDFVGDCRGFTAGGGLQYFLK